MPPPSNSNLHTFDASEKPNLTLRDTISRGAMIYPTLTAFHDKAVDKSMSYLELEKRTNSLARALQGYDIKKGDHVSVMAENTFRYMEIYGATLKLGGVCCPVADMFADDELVNVINSLEARVIFVMEKFTPVIARIRPRLLHIKHAIAFNTSASYEVTPADRVPDFLVYEELVSENSSDTLTEPAHIDEGQTALMLLTSGTTGVPKAAMLSHRAVIHTIQSSGKLIPMPGSAVVLYNSFAWIGACIFTFASLLNGGCVVILNRYRPDVFWPALVEHKSPIALFLPQQVKDFTALPEETVQRLKEHLKLVVCGGGVIPLPFMKKAAELLFPAPIMNTYGMTEMLGLGGASPMVSIAATNAAYDSDETRLLATVGHPSPGVTVAIVRDDDSICDVGESGNVVARGPSMMTGYYKRPDATAAALRGGWMRTGDLGYKDEQGRLFIAGRSKDMINLDSGYNVYPIELENVISKMSAVRNVCVVGVSDAEGGNERAVACVVREEASPSLTAQQVVDFCVGKLADFKIPAAVAFVDNIPLNANGKDLKRELVKIVPSILIEVQPKGP